ncbi:MAG: hypothetical protein Q4A07_10695 [Coriobacteriales bacterium]|nr:hypothetical protein [Coriobacteriales bacterium]
MSARVRSMCKWTLTVLVWAAVLVLLLGPCARNALAAKGDAQAADAQAADAQTSEQAPRITPAVVKKIHVTVSFVGDETWATEKLSLTEGSSAWDATRVALTSAGLAYRTGAESTQDVIVSLTNKDGSTLTSDSTLGSGWHLYLDGERCQGSSSTIELADGAEVEWRYEVGTIKVTVAVVGPGGTGDSYWIPPTSVRMRASETVWDASLKVFSKNGYSGKNLISYTTGPNGEIWLDSLAALGENGITGELWQLFVNGVLCSTDAAHAQIRSGDSICWYYSGHGVSSLPSFVAETGAGTQDPATTVSIDGLVTQAWASVCPIGGGSYEAIDRARGLCVAGAGESAALVQDGGEVMSPLAQTLADARWRQSLSHVLSAKLATGEGVKSALALDDGLYYMSDKNVLVRLEPR